MKIIFTLCSNNYLAQALVLWRSVRKHEPAAVFIIGLTDKKDPDIDYNSFGCEVLEVSGIEPALNSLAQKFSIIELNTCVKPRFFEYFLEETNAKQITYLDPDTCLFSPLKQVDELLQSNDLVVTPHVLQPIPLDGHTPEENLFLNYGLYNLGFLSLKRSAGALQFARWWKERTYEKGYDKPAIGLFTDQLWVNLLPLYFDKVAILRDPGYNMAPWNLHERTISTRGSQYIVNNNAPLAFYHFSSYSPTAQKLHREYTRYQWSDRPDLHDLYTEYKHALEREDYYEYKTYHCYYVSVRKKFLEAQKAVQEREEAAAFEALPYPKKLLKKVKQMIPGRVKRITLNLIRS